MWNHRDLCNLALIWLKRPNSRKAPGCAVALSECRTGFVGEIPDAIGFRTSLPFSGSVLVEVKTSRADFLADKNKPHRLSGGVGDWRYYMAPEGVLSVEDMPEKWGLLEVNIRGHIKVRRGLARYYANYGDFKANAEKWRFNDTNKEHEWYLMARVLANTNPQRQLEIIRESNRRNRDATRSLQQIARKLGLPTNTLTSEILRTIESKQYIQVA